MDNAPTGLLPGKDYVSLISADNFGLGNMAAELLARQLPDLQGLFVVWDTPCDEVLAVMANRHIAIPVATVDLGHDVSVSLASGGLVIGISAQQPLLHGQAVARTTIATLLGRGCPEWVSLPGIAVTRVTVAESHQTIWRTPAPHAILQGLDLLS